MCSDFTFIGFLIVYYSGTSGSKAMPFVFVFLVSVQIGQDWKAISKLWLPLRNLFGQNIPCYV